MLGIARHWVRGADIYRGGLPCLPISESFDLVVCARSLSHVEDLPAAAIELKRVTAAGGTLLLSDVDSGHPYEHTRLPTDDGDYVFARTCKHRRLEVVSGLEKAGFSVDMICLIDAPSGEIHDVTGRDDGRSATGWALAATG